MELLPPGWQDLSAEGVVILGVIMLMLGWLVPKRIYDRQMADKDATIQFQRETIAALTSAATNLAIPAKTAAAALRSIAREADTPKGGDE
jgi:hypothetical protein